MRKKRSPDHVIVYRYLPLRPCQHREVVCDDVDETPSAFFHVLPRAVNIVWCPCLFICFLLLLLALLRWDDHRCATSADCGESNACVEATCVDGSCKRVSIDNCCLRDEECDVLSPCSKGICDERFHSCVLTPVIGACDDNNACTQLDTCANGTCGGVPIDCAIDNACRVHSCDPRVGCVYSNKVDGTVCDTSDACSQTGTCVSGVCAAAPVDCSHLTDGCNVGTCVDGSCQRIPQPGKPCNDHQKCTVNDHCDAAGQCRGVLRDCADGDPCTFDTCSNAAPNDGCVSTHDFDTCQQICSSDDDCDHQFTIPYQCHDGNCLAMDLESQVNFHFTAYTLDSCFANSSWYRLKMDFVLDTEAVDVNGETRYRIIRSAADVTGLFPSAFPNDVLYISSSVYSQQTARTTFSLTTTCADLSTVCYRFVNQKFEFRLSMDDCLPSATWSECLENTATLATGLELSLLDCPLSQNETREVTILPTVTVVKSVDVDHLDPGVFGTRDRAKVLLHTAGVDNPWITDIRLCIPDDQFPGMGECVVNSETAVCPARGCRGTEDYLMWTSDFMIDGVITSAAKTGAFNLATCRPFQQYVDTCAEDAVFCVDDYFSFNFSGVPMYSHNVTVVIDIQYDLCLEGGGVDRRRSVAATPHHCPDL